jgi:sulfur carrier protein ThiS
MEVIKDLGLDPDLVAVVMVNGRQTFKSYRLQDGDRVKLVPMVGGG